MIDLNYYPSEECRRSNRRHRPIGIGIMGLADVLARLAIVYGSSEAQAIARGIAATVYYGALLESCRLAKASGRPYETFAGSPLSQASSSRTSGSKKARLPRTGSSRSRPRLAVISRRATGQSSA